MTLAVWHIFSEIPNFVRGIGNLRPTVSQPHAGGNQVRSMRPALGAGLPTPPLELTAGLHERRVVVRLKTIAKAVGVLETFGPFSGGVRRPAPSVAATGLHRSSRESKLAAHIVKRS